MLNITWRVSDCEELGGVFKGDVVVGFGYDLHMLIGNYRQEYWWEVENLLG